MRIEDEIKQLILDSVNKIDDSISLNVEEINIEIPKNNENGDFSTNIAMKLSKQLKDNPLNNAQKIIDNLEYDPTKIKEVVVAKPGFINIYLKQDAILNVLDEIIKKGKDYGQWPIVDDVLLNVEYVSANPTGDLHLGHARQASLGDSITRLYKKAGYKVTREYYINDAGNQINNLAQSVIVRYHELYNFKMEMPADGYHGQDIIDIANMIKTLVGDKYLNDESEECFEFFKKTALQFELDKLKEDLADFRVEFDQWTSEQKLYDDGKVEECLDILKNKNAIYEEAGALWLDTMKYGDDKNRVLRKSDGSYTYLTPDIANHIQKLEAGASQMIDLWGADHHGYIKRMAAALEIITNDSNRFQVDIVQMVRLISDGKEVKMSKRTGNAIGLRDLCEDIGVDAVRYFFASRAGSSHFDFDLDLASSKTSENPVYYAQYAHARISSILNIAQEIKDLPVADNTLLVNQKEFDLIKHLNEFPNVIKDAALSRSPHKITNYIQKLASLFHSYYNEYKVIDQSNLELSSARLNLLLATKIVLANALDLVGVHAPNKM